MVHVLLIVVCIGAMYIACEWFLNAVEWLGARLNLGSTAVGSILAAIGTAMPEAIITFMALAFGTAAAKDGMAVGSALGGPLVVSTVAVAAAGIAMMVSRARRDKLALAPAIPMAAAVGGDRGVLSPVVPDFTSEDERMWEDELGADGRVHLSPDERSRIGLGQRWFIVVFAITTVIGMVAFPGKAWVGVVLFGVYALYFRAEMRGEEQTASDEGLDRLKFQPKAASPATWAIVLQIAFTLVLMFWSSHTFVQQIEWAGPAMGLSPLVVALLLCPVATELPETLNAVIWARQGKTKLALANVTGSMMIQGTIPAGLAMIGTPWAFDTPALLASSAILAVAVYLWAVFRSGRIHPMALVGALGFYLAFAVGLVVTLA